MAGVLPAEAVTQMLRVCETGERHRQMERKRSMYFQINKALNLYPKQKLQEVFRVDMKRLMRTLDSDWISHITGTFTLVRTRVRMASEFGSLG